jgi:hypothetical protein
MLIPKNRKKMLSGASATATPTSTAIIIVGLIAFFVIRGFSLVVRILVLVNGLLGLVGAATIVTSPCIPVGSAPGRLFLLLSSGDYVFEGQ